MHNPTMDDENMINLGLMSYDCRKNKKIMYG